MRELRGALAGLAQHRVVAQRHLVEDEGRGRRAPQPQLPFFGLAQHAGQFGIDQQQAAAPRRSSQAGGRGGHREQPGEAAVGDVELGAVEAQHPVAARGRHGLERGQVAARLRLGGGEGRDGLTGGQRRQPALLLRPVPQATSPRVPRPRCRPTVVATERSASARVVTTRVASSADSPAPPYSAGKVTPKSPSSPRPLSTAGGIVCSRSISRERMFALENSRTLRSSGSTTSSELMTRLA